MESDNTTQNNDLKNKLDNKISSLFFCICRYSEKEMLLFTFCLFLSLCSGLMLFSTHHLVRKRRFPPYDLARCELLPVPGVVAANRHPRHFARRRMDSMGKRSWKNNVLSGLGEDSVGIIEGGHWPSGIRK